MHVSNKRARLKGCVASTKVPGEHRVQWWVHLLPPLPSTSSQRQPRSVVEMVGRLDFRPLERCQDTGAGTRQRSLTVSSIQGNGASRQAEEATDP